MRRRTIDLARLHNLAETARQRSEVTDPRAQRREGRSWYRIENAATGTPDAPAAVYLYDAIGEWGVTAADFVNDLRGIKGAAFDLHINCEGGEVHDGLAIYESMIMHPAEITGHIDGIAASAASFIAMACDKIIVAPRGRVMIHDAHGFAMGNARDMHSMGDLLEALSDNIADIYAERAGGTRAEWRAAMKAAKGGPDGTWYSAQEAVAAGLADEVRGEGGPAGTATARPAADLAPLPLWVDQEHVERDAVAVAEWDPAAMLNAVREIENPPKPVKVPDGSALRSLFDLA